MLPKCARPHGALAAVRPAKSKRRGTPASVLTVPLVRQISGSEHPLVVSCVEHPPVDPRVWTIQSATHDTLGNGKTWQSFCDVQPITDLFPPFAKHVSQILTLPVDCNLNTLTVLGCVGDHRKHPIQITGNWIGEIAGHRCSCRSQTGRPVTAIGGQAGCKDY